MAQAAECVTLLRRRRKVSVYIGPPWSAMVMESAFPGGFQIRVRSFCRRSTSRRLCRRYGTVLSLSLRSQPTADARLRVSFQATAGCKLGAERRCHGHGVSVVKLSKETEEPCVDFVDAPGLRVSYGEAHEEMEESSADVIGYGMSVVAKDTGPWCSLRRRSTCRRHTSASPRPADSEMPLDGVLPETAGYKLEVRSVVAKDDAAIVKLA